jgi:hypothetical protein
MQGVTNFPERMWIFIGAVSGSVSYVTIKSSWRARAFTSNAGTKSMTGFTGLLFLVFHSGIRENGAVNMIRFHDENFKKQYTRDGIPTPVAGMRGPHDWPDYPRRSKIIPMSFRY